MADVSFDTIVDGIRTNTHHFEADASSAVQTINTTRKKALLIGRRLTTGSVAELVPRKILGDTTGDAYFGAGSELAEMCRIFKKNNKQIECWAVSQTPLSGGTAGVKTITVTVTTALQGTIHLYIAGMFYVPVAVPAGTAQNSVATLINTAIQAHLGYSRMPFTTSVATNVVTCTMRWKGADVADIRVNYQEENLPGGVSIAIATSVAGVGNPDLDAALDTMADERFTHIVVPYNDATNNGILATELWRRFGGMVMKDGVCFQAIADSHANTTTQGNSLNSPLITLMGANTSPTPHYLWAAANCAAVSAQSHPARPFQTIKIAGVLPAQRSARWTQDQRNLLLFDGVATHVVNDAGEVTIERQITTYQTNAQSVPDPSYLDLNTIFQYWYCRDDLLGTISLQHPRSLLGANGDTVQGLPIMTPNGMKGLAASRYALWAEAGVTKKSGLQQFVNEMVVVRDSTDVNRLKGQFPPEFMNQFLGISASIPFRLSQPIF